MNLGEVVQEIRERNRRVEADKAWETSHTRILLLCLITYFIAVMVFVIIQAAHPWAGALVPAAGFFLSTRTLPVAKKIWLSKFYQKEGV